MKRVRETEWPVLKGVAKGALDTLANGVECMRWTLPLGTCSLVWAPWPAELDEPPLAAGGYFRPMQMYDKSVLMPRRTWSYDHTYTFSGQTHPVETETPPQVRALYAWANAACGVADAERDGFNMDLCNHYATGFHCISAHSDDMRQFGARSEIFCFVTGSARREVVIREKASKKVALRGVLPSGVYAMVGRDFQLHYTHEFPRLHDALFKLVVKQGPKWFPDTWPPTETPNAELAEWLARHADEVLRRLDPKQARKWKEWVLPRTSHTLRNFKELA